MKYDNESSAASTADKAKNVKGAVVAIENNGERCILYLSYIDNIWHITKDETYNG